MKRVNWWKYKVVVPVDRSRWEFTYWHIFCNDGGEAYCSVENCDDKCIDKRGWCMFLQWVEK